MRSVLRPQLWLAPELTATKAPPGGSTWPKRLSPQHARVWSVLIAQLWLPPPLRARKVPLGGSALPPSSLPQHVRVPSGLIPQVWEPPVLLRRVICAGDADDRHMHQAGPRITPVLGGRQAGLAAVRVDIGRRVVGQVERPPEAGDDAVEGPHAREGRRLEVGRQNGAGSGVAGEAGRKLELLGVDLLAVAVAVPKGAVQVRGRSRRAVVAEAVGEGDDPAVGVRLDHVGGKRPVHYPGIVCGSGDRLEAGHLGDATDGQRHEESESQVPAPTGSRRPGQEPLSGEHRAPPRPGSGRTMRPGPEPAPGRDKGWSPRPGP